MAVTSEEVGLKEKWMHFTSEEVSAISLSAWDKLQVEADSHKRHVLEQLHHNSCFEMNRRIMTAELSQEVA